MDVLRVVLSWCCGFEGCSVSGNSRRLGSRVWIRGFRPEGFSGGVSFAEFRAVECVALAAEDIAHADRVMAHERPGDAQLPRHLRLGHLAVQLVEASRECDGVRHDRQVVRFEKKPDHFAKGQRLLTNLGGLEHGDDLAGHGGRRAEFIGEGVLRCVDV